MQVLIIIGIGHNITWMRCVSVCPVARSCLILCSPMDCRLTGSSVLVISQARILEWICHFLLQGIFQIQGFNPHLLQLLHWQGDSPPIGTWEVPWMPCINWKDIFNLLLFPKLLKCVNTTDFFLIFYWRLVALQGYVSFCCTAKWISYVYTNILSFLCTSRKKKNTIIKQLHTIAFRYQRHQTLSFFKWV